MRMVCLRRAGASMVASLSLFKSPVARGARPRMYRKGEYIGYGASLHPSQPPQNPRPRPTKAERHQKGRLPVGDGPFTNRTSRKTKLPWLDGPSAKSAPRQANRASQGAQVRCVLDVREHLRNAARRGSPTNLRHGRGRGDRLEDAVAAVLAAVDHVHVAGGHVGEDKEVVAEQVGLEQSLVDGERRELDELLAQDTPPAPPRRAGARARPKALRRPESRRPPA